MRPAPRAAARPGARLRWLGLLLIASLAGSAHAEPSAPRVEGWEGRNARLSLQGGALVVEADSDEQPFLQRSGIELAGPIELRLRLRASEAGRGAAGWRLAGEERFAPAHVVPLTVRASASWQELRATLPAAGVVSHVRVLLPEAGRVEIASLELRSAAPGADSVRAWHFGDCFAIQGSPAIRCRAGAGASPAPAADRPNLILILTDDQDAASASSMPNLNALVAQRGVTFPNAFVTEPLCCPSRTSILRGQYPHNAGVLSNDPPIGGFPRFMELGLESSTIGTWLQAAGYRTGYFGKYLKGYPGRDRSYVPAGWDAWQSPARGNPYLQFDYTLNQDGELVDYGRRPEDYLTDVLARGAGDFIRAAAASGHPFFLHLAPYPPHGPSVPAPRHRDRFATAKAPRPASFDEADVADKPAWVQGRARLTASQTQAIDERYRNRLRSLQSVDEMIARLVGVLEETGQLSRTYLIFTSDNGLQLGEHRIEAGKNAPYEESLRVPLVVRGPGIPEGVVLPHAALNIDLAPTLAELGGAKPPEFVDGRSLVPLLRGSPPPLGSWRQGFLAERHRPERGALAPTGIPGWLAVRGRDLVYVEYETGERELYDLAKDPQQLTNLYPGTSDGMRGKLAAWLASLRTCAREGCRAAEDGAAPRLDAP